MEFATSNNCANQFREQVLVPLRLSVVLGQWPFPIHHLAARQRDGLGASTALGAESQRRANRPTLAEFVPFPPLLAEYNRSGPVALSAADTFYPVRQKREGCGVVVVGVGVGVRGLMGTRGWGGG